jgi:hypothetical protein
MVDPSKKNIEADARSTARGPAAWKHCGAGESDQNCEGPKPMSVVGSARSDQALRELRTRIAERRVRRTVGE